MRRISRLPEPEWLRDNRQRVSDEFSSGARADLPYSHESIKAVLRTETCDKCAYCESPTTAATYGEVEHIRPKSSFPALTLEWSNLTWVCPPCNREKRDYWQEDLQLLDPTREDPEGHLVFHGALPCARNGSERGKFTIRKLKLRRTGLMEARMAAITALDNLLDSWHQLDGPRQEVIADEICSMIDHSVPHSAVLRAFAAGQGFPVD